MDDNCEAQAYNDILSYELRDHHLPENSDLHSIGSP